VIPASNIQRQGLSRREPASEPTEYSDDEE
jgi:hypothetical protein